MKAQLRGGASTKERENSEAGLLIFDMIDRLLIHR